MTAAALTRALFEDLPPWMAPTAPSPVCAEVDPEMWFPGPGQWTTSRLARRLCQGCPLLAACRGWALAHPEETETGVWGGMTAEERDAWHAGQRELKEAG